MIKVGDTLPNATLMEYSDVEGEGCSIGPNPVDVAKASAGKTIALFALPGAFTPTCSAKHVPGYVEHQAALKAAGVDEIWCVSVNDAFVMGAWARDQKSVGKVRAPAASSACLMVLAVLAARHEVGRQGAPASSVHGSICVFGGSSLLCLLLAVRPRPHVARAVRPRDVQQPRTVAA